jgi:hypothetical protein
MALLKVMRTVVRGSYLLAAAAARRASRGQFVSNSQVIVILEHGGL